MTSVDLHGSRLEATRVLVPCGMLGTGVRQAELVAGLALKPHAIAVDAGSTDSGPAYLATATSKNTREAVKRDLELLMAARQEAAIPLLVGSCGTSGADAAVDWTLEIVLEIARAQGISPKIALLYAEQDKGRLKAMAKAGAIEALAPSPAVDDDIFNACTHIVALLGPEPYMAAVEAGADIVLGGRTTDTAVLAAVPLLRRAPAGPAWHAAKIAECGGVCTVNPMIPGVMISVDEEGFDVAPLSPTNRCTPKSVSAHMLYENSNPFQLVEPGGTLDVSESLYIALDDRSVRVTGSRFEPASYTMKLEGAGGGPYQTVMLVGIQEPSVLQDINGFVTRMSQALEERVQNTLGSVDGAFELSLRPYGWNAVSGRIVPSDIAPPREIGLLLVVTAASQALATKIAKVCNPVFFHLPAHDGKEMPSYGFAFSPPEMERGQVFEFYLNHIVHTDGPFQLMRTKWVELQESEGGLHG